MLSRVLASASVGGPYFREFSTRPRRLRVHDSRRRASMPPRHSSSELCSRGAAGWRCWPAAEANFFATASRVEMPHCCFLRCGKSHDRLPAPELRRTWSAEVQSLPASPMKRNRQKVAIQRMHQTQRLFLFASFRDLCQSCGEQQSAPSSASRIPPANRVSTQLQLNTVQVPGTVLILIRLASRVSNCVVCFSRVSNWPGILYCGDAELVLWEHKEQ